MTRDELFELIRGGEDSHLAFRRDDSLERMLTDLESDLVERKESFRGDSPERVREAVCTFANDLPDHRNEKRRHGDRPVRPASRALRHAA